MKGGEIMSSVLEITFLNELNRMRNIRVPDVRGDVSDAEVAMAMNNIIAKNVFTSSGGDLTGKVRARVITTTRSEVNIV